MKPFNGLLLLALVLSTCAAPATPHPKATPFTGARRAVIIDTDMAPDDWRAILYLLRRQDVDVQAITVAGTGEAHCGPGVRNALSLAALAGQPNIPVSCGSETALAGGHPFPDAWRASADAALGLRLPANPNGPASQAAPTLIRSAAAAAPGQVVLLTLGPLTNVAEALRAPAVGLALKYGDDFALTAAAPTGTPAAALEAAAGSEAAGSEAIPVLYHGLAIARLLVAPRAPSEAYGPADRRLLHELARQAAPAVHAFRLANDLRRSRERLVLAGEEERRRLSRDLHDGLGPALASQALKLEAALELLERDPAQAARLLVEVKDQTQSVVGSVRQLVYALRPPPLDQLGLIESIRAHAQSLSPNSGLVVTLESSALPPLPAAVELAAYRIVLEAFTNVMRHAHASQCCIRLSAPPAEARLALEVSDNGQGLPPEPQPGLGLTSMRERAEELGGGWHIATQPAGGVRVWVSLPLGPANGYG